MRTEQSERAMCDALNENAHTLMFTKTLVRAPTKHLVPYSVDPLTPYCLYEIVRLRD